MGKKIDSDQRERLIRDIVGAQHDLVALGRDHELSPDDLAGWIGDPDNQRVLNGLCVLADLQTQILLSRYRLLAAGRLIRLATEEGAEGSPDVARRACVDLLKLDLKRADFDEGRFVLDGQSSGEGGEERIYETLRKLLYGEGADGGGVSVEESVSSQAESGCDAELPNS